MLTEDNIRKLTDFLLLNAYSVSSTGLNSGKAGMSLCLFEVARYLNDEYLEDNAFELLQESLLSKNEDISFENGLSGIGYVLQYLISNQFVEADFDEFFGTQTAKIVTGIDKCKDEPKILLNSFKIIYFLVSLYTTKNDIEIKKCIKTIFDAVELFLAKEFTGFNSVDYQGDKATVMTCFEDYLQLLDYSNYQDFSHSLLSAYADLYRQNRIASSYRIGYYLEKISHKYHFSDYTDIVQLNKTYSLSNIKPDLLSLKARLEMLQLFTQDPSVDSVTIASYINGLFDVHEDDLEKNIISQLPNEYSLSGFGNGVACYLSYSVKLADFLNEFQTSKAQQL